MKFQVLAAVALVGYAVLHAATAEQRIVPVGGKVGPGNKPGSVPNNGAINVGSLLNIHRKVDGAVEEMTQLLRTMISHLNVDRKIIIGLLARINKLEEHH